MNKPELAIFSASAATTLGGTESYVMNEARCLSDEFTIKLVAGRGRLTDDFRNLITRESIPYTSFPYIPRTSALSRLLFRSWMGSKIHPFDVEAMSLLFSPGNLRSALSDADIVEVNHPLEGLAFAYTGKETARVMHIHGPWLPPLYKFFRGRIERCLDMIITVSEWSAGELARNYGMKGAEVVYNAVDTGLFSPGPKVDFAVKEEYDRALPRIGTVGRLGRTKGTDILYGVAREMTGKAEFFAVGPPEGTLPGEMQGKGLSNFHFVGPLTSRELPDFYRFIDVFALPSRFEALSIALLEAMSCGKASIASHVGGLPEVIEQGRDGLLVPPGDGTLLKESIERLIGEKDLREKLGVEAREKVLSKFSPEKTFEKLRYLYRSLLDGSYRKTRPAA